MWLWGFFASQRAAASAGSRGASRPYDLAYGGLTASAALGAVTCGGRPRFGADGPLHLSRRAPIERDEMGSPLTANPVCRPFGLKLLDMARNVAAFNLPRRVGQLFGVGLYSREVANAPAFSRPVGQAMSRWASRSPAYPCFRRSLMQQPFQKRHYRRPCLAMVLAGCAKWRFDRKDSSPFIARN